MNFKFEIGEHVAIYGGEYYGQNGKVFEQLVAGTKLVYAVKVLTGPYRDMKGTTVIREEHLRPE